MGTFAFFRFYIVLIISTVTSKVQHVLYVVYLLYAIASIVAIIGALQIYIKMNTGEGDVTKSIMMLVGACLFMIGATIIFPAFFGYNIV